MIEPSERDGSGGPDRLSPLMRLVAALAICAPLLTPLGSPGLLNPDEGRYTEIGREMAATGDWMVPRLHGIPHWAKPPLSYWAIGASVRALGTTERAARLPSAIAATLGLLATWFLARRMGGVRVALLSVVMLATMALFHGLGRFASADMIQTACITWAAALTWSARSRAPDRRLLPRLGAFLGLGLAFLDKGPVGLGVFFSAVLVYWLVRPRLSIFSWRHAAIGIVAVLAVGLPWFLYVIRLHPDLFDFFLGSEVRDRYLSGKHHRTQPFWFFPAVMVGGTLPWTPAFAASLGALVGLIRREGASESSDSARFLLAWIVGPFVLFSFSGSKLATYLLPLMPFCAVATGRWIAAIQENPGARRPWLASATSMRVVLAVAAITLALEWTVPSVVDEDRVNLASHASHAWVRDALAKEDVRGVPIGATLRPSGAPAPGPAPTFASYELKTNTLAFYLLGMRAERFEDFGNAEGWEMKSDQDQAHTPDLADLVLLLRGPERVHVLTGRNAVAKLEAALGHPLREVAAHGSGKNTVVLVANH